MRSFYFYFFLLVACLCLADIAKADHDSAPNVVENGGKKEEGDEHNMDNNFPFDLGDLHKMMEGKNSDEETLKLLESLKKFIPQTKEGGAESVDEKKEGSVEESKNESNIQFPPNMGMPNANFLHGMMDPQYVSEMLKFYTYLQDVLNSKTETTEKTMVRKFLRKSMQNIKDNEKKSDKKTVEEIIQNTEGHQEMLQKFAEVMKIDQESLKNEETRSALDKILVGILKFMEYTNDSNIVDSLLDEIEVKEVDHENGGKQKKFQVNIQNSKTHFEILQKASNFMGLNLTDEHIKELTTQNQWYQDYLNHLLNYNGEEDEL